MLTGDDEEVAALNAEYAGRWHVTRFGRSRALDFALEACRAYHIICLDAGEAAQMIARYEQNGYLVR